MGSFCDAVVAAQKSLSRISQKTGSLGRFSRDICEGAKNFKKNEKRSLTGREGRRYTAAMLTRCFGGAGFASSLK